MRVRFSLEKVLLLLLLSSIAALVLAYISQFGFGLQPCILCFYQRKPFFAIIALCLLALKIFKKENFRKFAFFSCIALLFLNAGIAAYHTGVEKKIFKGPTTCSDTGLEQITTVEELKTALMNTRAVRCDEPAFFFLGLSMAAWNFIFCASLAAFALILFFGLNVHRRAHHF